MTEHVSASSTGSSSSSSSSRASVLFQDATYLDYLDSATRRALFQPGRPLEEIFLKKRKVDPACVNSNEFMKVMRSFVQPTLEEYGDPLVENAFLIHSVRSSGSLFFVALILGLGHCLSAGSVLASGFPIGYLMLAAGVLQLIIAMLTRFAVHPKIDRMNLEQNAGKLTDEIFKEEVARRETVAKEGSPNHHGGVSFSLPPTGATVGDPQSKALPQFEESSTDSGSGPSSAPRKGPPAHALATNTPGIPQMETQQPLPPPHSPPHSLSAGDILNDDPTEHLYLGMGLTTTSMLPELGASTAELKKRVRAKLFPTLLGGVELYHRLCLMMVYSGVLCALWTYPWKHHCLAALSEKPWLFQYKLCIGNIWSWVIPIQTLGISADFPRPTRYLLPACIVPIAMYLSRWLSGPWDQEDTIDLVIGIMCQSLFGPVLVSGASLVMERYQRKNFETFIHLKRVALAVGQQYQAIERTLQVAVPPSTMIHLRDGAPPIDYSEQCTVVICAVDNFRNWSTSMTPPFMVTCLDALFVFFDQRCGDFGGARKIKTLADSYIVAHGLDSSSNFGSSNSPNSSSSRSNNKINGSGGLSGNNNIASACNSSNEYDSSMALHLSHWMICVSAYISPTMVLKAASHTGSCLGGLVGGQKSRSLWYEVSGEAINVALALIKSTPAGQSLASRSAILAAKEENAFGGRKFVTVSLSATESVTSFLIYKGGFPTEFYGPDAVFSGRTASSGSSEEASKSNATSTGPVAVTQVVGDKKVTTSSSSFVNNDVLNSSYKSTMSSNSATRTSRGTISAALAGGSESSRANRERVAEKEREAQNRHLFLREKLLAPSMKERKDGGFFGLEAAAAAIQVQMQETSKEEYAMTRGFLGLVWMGKIFNLDFASTVMEANYLEVLSQRKKIGLVLLGIVWWCAIPALGIVMTHLAGVATTTSTCIMATIVVIGMLTRNILTSKSAPTLPPIADVVILGTLYLLSFIALFFIKPCALNANTGFLVILCSTHMLVCSVRVWWVWNAAVLCSTFMLHTIFMTLMNGGDRITAAVPLWIISMFIAARNREVNRRRYFRNKRSVATLVEAAENELSLFRELTRLLVPPSVVDIVVAKAACTRSPCVESLAEVCVAGLEITPHSSSGTSSSSTQHFPSIIGGTALTTVSINDPSSDAIARNKNPGLSPLEKFRQLEGIFVTVEEALVAARPTWSQTSLDEGPLVERMYTLGDRIFFAGPLRERAKPQLPAKSVKVGAEPKADEKDGKQKKKEQPGAVIGHVRSDLVANEEEFACKNSAGQEDILFSGCLTLCNLVRKLQRKGWGSRGAEVDFKAILHQGPSFASVLGFSRPTFHLMGSALQTCELLLEAAPSSNFIGATDRFHDLMSRGLGGAPLIDEEETGKFASGSHWSSHGGGGGVSSTSRRGGTRRSPKPPRWLTEPGIEPPGSINFLSSSKSSNQEKKKVEESKDVDSGVQQMPFFAGELDDDEDHRSQQSPEESTNRQGEPSPSATLQSGSYFAADSTPMFSAPEKWKVKGVGVVKMHSWGYSSS